MKLLNYSAEYENVLYSWLPHDLEAETVVFLPDACPGNSPLPTGTVVKTSQPSWRKFAVSDCGCGMLFAKANISVDEFEKEKWDMIYDDLRSNKGKLGDLGSGNHFLDALQSYDDDRLYFLIHTGSRDESKAVETIVGDPAKFDRTFKEVCEWARSNRSSVLKIVEKYFGKTEQVLDVNHNDFEMISDGSVIIRKGAVRVLPGQQTVIPSSMEGDIVLVEARETISKSLNSMSHGTGRVMSRSQAKIASEGYDYNALRERIYIPEKVSNDSIKTEAPFCYRDIDGCLALIKDLVVEKERFSPIAYLGQI